MSEASAFCGGHVDAVTEMIWAFAAAGCGSIMEIKTQWTIDDFVEGWILLQRKAWMEEAHTMMTQEQAEET